MDFSPPPHDEINAKPPPSYRLFDGQAAGIATFLGTIFAGAIVLALNEFKLERAGRGVLILAAGFVITVIYSGIAFFAPDQLSGVFTFINIGIAAAVSKLTTKYYADDFAAHEADGGTVGMRGWAAGIGIGMLVVVIACIVGVVVVAEIVSPEQSEQCLNYKAEENVCFTPPVSEVDAQCVMDVVVDYGAFDGEGGATAFLTRDEEATQTVFAFVVIVGMEHDPAFLEDYRKMSLLMNERCFPGETMRFELLNPDRVVLHTMP